MKTTTLWIVLIAVLAAPTLAAEETPAEKQLKRGDRFYDRRDKGRKWVEKAKECYEKALALDTRSVEASWRLAQAAYWLGDREKATQKLRLIPLTRHRSLPNSTIAGPADLGNHDRFIRIGFLNFLVATDNVVHRRVHRYSFPVGE